MKISAAAILIFSVVFFPKTTEILGDGEGDDSSDGTPDADDEIDTKVAKNQRFPGFILDECGVGRHQNVNAEKSIPSCDCIRKFDSKGSEDDDITVSLAVPGVNCEESENGEKDKQE